MTKKKTESVQKFDKYIDKTSIWKPTESTFYQCRVVEDHFEIEKDCEHNEKGWDQYTDLTEGYECGRGNFEFELRYIYAKKLLELPYDYVFKTFTVIDRKKSIYNPLTDFFSIFEDMFDRQGMSGLSVDWEQIDNFYEKHKHYYE